MKTNTLHNLPIAAFTFIVASLFISCSELKTDLPLATSSTAQLHDPGWADTTSFNFHGTALKAAQYNPDQCTTCHSKQYTGGVSGVSCFKCHSQYPHPSGWALPSGHPQTLYAQNYPLTQCKLCHGASYTGARDANLTCEKSGCHVDAAGTPKSPEACNTCHGVFNGQANDLISAAPPKSVAGNTDPSTRGVGAHQNHLLTGTLGKSVKCQECHTVPSQLTSPGHLGTLPAEVVFSDTLARLPSGGGAVVPNPTYDPSTLRCSNTFCHGNWKLTKSKAVASNQFIFTDSVMVGGNFAPTWTGGSAQDVCGSCHGIPPPGHLVLPVSTCGQCHAGIVSSDGKITNKAQHMNGKINVFNQEYSF